MSGCRFYVYEHWRPDTDMCFWVGKGTGDRARRFRRNPDYDSVVQTLAKVGMCVEVRMVASGLTEIDAFRIECERIAFWRHITILTNRSRGGTGNRAAAVSAETRAKLRAANLGKKQSAATKAKISAALKGRRGNNRKSGFCHSAKTIEKMRVAAAGRRISEETKRKLRIANLGKKHSPKTKAKMSLSRIGNRNGAGGRGVKRSEKTIVRMSLAQIGKTVSTATRRKLAKIAKDQNQERGEDGRFRSSISSS